ncbi:IS5 family transposase [Streptomyces formicae]
MAPDGLWELFERVVPPAPERPQGGGRRRHGDRGVLAAIIFVATSGCTWNQLPPGFGPSGMTAFRRLTEWSKARVWATLHRLVLDELGARGELDWSRYAIDSVSVRALKKGASDGTESDRSRQERIENPPHRRPQRPAPVDRHHRGEPADSQALTPLMRGTPPIRSPYGPRRRRPATLHADKGYDFNYLRNWLRRRQIVPRIARRGIEASDRLGQHRWVIERTMS